MDAATEAPDTPTTPSTDDLLELAWGIIANAGHGDWTRESPDWQNAAARWRDQYHEAIGARTIVVAPLG